IHANGFSHGLQFAYVCSVTCLHVASGPILSLSLAHGLKHLLVIHKRANTICNDTGIIFQHKHIVYGLGDRVEVVR
ncbi:MAG: hypothetical protein VXA66_08185, partial [Alphaproteobacteria bacterium]